ncbi:hypothetical protein MBLNU230_g4695t1 [Neophaeotheca triangularis]
MSQTVVRLAERANTNVPPYEFIELIGKGSFGRVYKCLSKKTGTLVAVKIISVDDSDFAAHPLDKDETLKDFRKEVSILHQLKEKKAQNVNMIHEAFDLHSQLWIVSEYCTGGSVRTLMRAQPTSNPGLEERFIIPISRELALALKSVHEIGVIHRDIKATNVYVTEDGKIQLGDFGIVGVPEDGKSKRTTIVGTPHYMPLEFHISDTLETEEAYGTEVDVWSFGITVYEMAVGHVPNPRVGREDLGIALNQAPRLEGGNYSQELRDFVAFCLDNDAKLRPSITEVLQHPFIANSEQDYPTGSLTQLIERYALWEFGGGQRSSLWMPGGAEAPTPETDEPDIVGDFDDWNFSTSDDFNDDFGRRYSHMIQLDMGDPQLQAPEGSGLPPINTQVSQDADTLDSKMHEWKIERGERSLDRLWNAQAEPYKLHSPVGSSQTNDLPLRSMGSSAPRESVIDLDSAGAQDQPPTFNFDFDELPTIKAKHRALGDDDDDLDEMHHGEDDANTKRATRDWKFPAVRAEESELKRATMDWTFPASTASQGPRATMDWSFSTAGLARAEDEEEEQESQMNLPPQGDGGSLAPGFRPTLKHMATEPIGQFGDYMHTTTTLDRSQGRAPSPTRTSMGSMIDLDMGGTGDVPDLTRPSSASSAHTESTSGNPFDLEEDPAQNEIDRNRFSHHRQWRSEDARHSIGASDMASAVHARMASESSSDSEFERTMHERQVAEAFAHNLAKTELKTPPSGGRVQLLAEDGTNWPGLGYGNALETRNASRFSLRTPSASRLQPPRSASRHGNGRPAPRGEVQFPIARPPALEALEEDASLGLVASELDRMLADLQQGLEATASALAQHAGIEDAEREGVGSGGESGYNSSAAGEGEEEGY